MSTSTSAALSRPNGRVVAALAVAGLALGAPAVAGAQAPADAQYGGGGTVTDATTGPQELRRVDYASFGFGDRNVRREVVRALDEGGLRFRRLDTTDARVQRFIAGTFARKEVSSGGAFALGTKVATTLRSTTPLADRVFHTIFTTDQAYAPIVAVVLTRGDQETAAQGRFVRGLATGFGSTGIPVVYAERSDDRRPHASEFRDIAGVGTVTNIDTAAGRQRLVQLLTGGSSATTASSSSRSVSPKTAAALVAEPDGGSASTVRAMAALLLGGVLFVVAGALRRRAS
jgi:hypothetical protein